MINYAFGAPRPEDVLHGYRPPIMESAQHVECRVLGAFDPSQFEAATGTSVAPSQHMFELGQMVGRTVTDEIFAVRRGLVARYPHLPVASVTRAVPLIPGNLDRGLLAIANLHDSDESITLQIKARLAHRYPETAIAGEVQGRFEYTDTRNPIIAEAFRSLLASYGSRIATFEAERAHRDRRPRQCSGKDTSYAALPTARLTERQAGPEVAS